MGGSETTKFVKISSLDYYSISLNIQREPWPDSFFKYSMIIIKTYFRSYH